MPVNIAHSILGRGEAGTVAVLAGRQAVTYGQLRELAYGVAAGLRGRGLGKGDRVVICSENSPFFVAAYLGVILAGMVAVPLPLDIPEASLLSTAKDTGAKWAFLSRRLQLRSGPLLSENQISSTSEPEMNAFVGKPHDCIPTEVDPRTDLAALMFTSGSTGSPKGVMVTHRNIEANTEDIISYLGLRSDDRVMVVLPFHYCFGLSLLHSHLLAGASLVLNNSFRLYPESVLKEINQHQCTGFAGVPSTYQLLLKESRFTRMSFPSLRWLQQAGGKLPNAQIEALTRAVPNARFFLMYGQTEGTARLSFLPPERLSTKLGSIGRGLAGTKLEVLRKDGEPVVPGSEETGEIVASGDNIALGYWNDPVESSKYFRNGKLHTGDIARVDADGFIFIVERERDFIKSGGNRVSAKEIEEAISQLPDVMEVAVLGCPHELLGECLVACVVSIPGSKLEESIVKQHCHNRLAGYKVPQAILFLDAMPHNDAGKVLKLKLKDIALARLQTPNGVSTNSMGATSATSDLCVQA